MPVALPLIVSRAQELRSLGDFILTRREEIVMRHTCAGLIQDARYAMRLLRRQPGFTAVAILTMALGIGATTTLFSVAYGVLLKPLPWPHADRLVRVTETRAGRIGRDRGARPERRFHSNQSLVCA